MKACVGVWLTEPGRIELRETELPSAGHGEVRIRTESSLISPGTELALLSGQARQGSAWAEFGRYPRTIGYSNAGIVESVGEGVDPGWIGQRVASRGAHADWVLRPVSDLRAIPDGIEFDDACFSTLAGVAMNGLRRVQFTWGESVAVFGLGLVGQLSARTAVAAGAGPVFGIDIDPARLDRLAGTSIQPMRIADAGPQAIRRANKGRLVDVVIEATACAELIPREQELLRDEGRLLMLSSPGTASRFDFHDGCNRRSISIVGAHGFSQPQQATPANPWTSPRHGELFLDWLTEGRLSVKELISHRLPYPRVADAYELLAIRSDNALGVILQWG